MNKFIITEELLIVIVRYLMSKPMAEVEQMVAMIRKLEKSGAE